MPTWMGTTPFLAYRAIISNFCSILKDLATAGPAADRQALLQQAEKTRNLTLKLTWKWK